MLKRFVVCLIALLAFTHPAGADFRSYAVVQDDASLLIRNTIVRLYGIYIPDPSLYCGRNLRPSFCGNRAAVALNFKIQGFVTCREMGSYNDGSISAVCWAGRSNFDDGVDLGAYLVREGLALAGPDAPFEYRALERIAQANGLGIWGFQVDSFRPAPRF
ncbi:MAG: thermonuclease family protein [Rhodospirillales bacterium]|nr:thermonuclease family protein [Rhodospirillales bacterium]